MWKEKQIDMTVQLLLSFMAYYGVSVYDDHNAIAWDFNQLCNTKKTDFVTNPSSVQDKNPHPTRVSEPFLPIPHADFFTKVYKSGSSRKCVFHRLLLIDKLGKS